MAEVRLVERLGYGSANAGSGLLFGLQGAFMLYFYTDVYHVGAAMVGTLFLIARAADAFFDPLLGFLIDRTETRYGKNRPFLLWMALPFALSGILVFATPALSPAVKTVYVFATYTVFGLLYSCVSLPLNSMLPSLTSDSRERTTVNVLREFLGSSAVLGIGFMALPTVHALGHGNDAAGFFRLALVCAVLACALTLLAFAVTRERHLPPPNFRVLTWRQSLAAARGNWPWWSTMLVNFFFWVGMVIHSQCTIYFVRDVLGRQGLVSALMASHMTALLGTASAAFLANRFGKRAVGMVGSVTGALCFAAVSVSYTEYWVLLCNGLGFFGLGLIGGLLFALMADAVEYGEWKSGFRAQGFLYAASSLGVKLGLSIGGAVGAWLLAAAGYKAGAPITIPVRDAIVTSYVWLPAIACVAMAASLTMFRTGRMTAAIPAAAEA